MEIWILESPSSPCLPEEFGSYGEAQDDECEQMRD